MLAMNDNNLDERQLSIRGDIFKRGFFLLIVTIFFNFFLEDGFGIIWAEGKWAELTCVLLAIVVTGVEFILYDIYPLGERRHRGLFLLLGVLGLVQVSIGLYELFMEKMPVATAGVISSDALVILHGMLFLALPVAYLYQQRRNKLAKEEP